MRVTPMLSKINRRQALKLTAAAAAGLAMPKPAFPQGCMAKEGTVRDRLWLFACATNSNYQYLNRRSLMSPAEGAYYLSIPNLLIIQSDEGQTPRFEPPFEQYAIGLRPLKRVAWSIVGSGGQTSPDERKEVLDLAKSIPNWVGVYMDDFFFRHNKQGKQAALTLEELGDIRQQLKNSGKKLDIIATFYTSLLDLPVRDYLELIDVIAYWTSNPADLENLSTNLDKLNKLAPLRRVLLGCYFFDYNQRSPLTVANMKLQCETGLRWLQQGRIEGIVFLGNTTEDMGFECVEWAREWIQKVGGTSLRDI